MLLDSIKNDLKIAMKAKDTLKISTLRMITSSIKNMEISNRGSSNEDSPNVSCCGYFDVFDVFHFDIGNCNKLLLQLRR